MIAFLRGKKGFFKEKHREMFPSYDPLQRTLPALPRPYALMRPRVSSSYEGTSLVPYELSIGGRVGDKERLQQASGGAALDNHRKGCTVL